MIRFSCPSCGRSLSAPESIASKQFRCPGCRKHSTVPLPAAIKEPPPLPAATKEPPPVPSPAPTSRRLHGAKQPLALGIVGAMALVLIVVFFLAVKRLGRHAQINAQSQPQGEAVQREDPEDVVKRLSRILDGDRKNYGALLERAQAYYDLREYDLAIVDASDAIAIDGQSFAAYLVRGRARKGNERYDAALEDLNKAIALKPDAAEGYFYRSWVRSYLRRASSEDDVVEATKAELADLNKAVQLNPSFALALDFRAITFSFMAEILDGRTVFGDQKPANPATVREYRQKAIADYTRLIQLEPDEKARLYLDRSKLYSSLGQEDLAEADRKTAENLAEIERAKKAAQRMRP
jgi:tetratricopeptide (TPR) repeat protein